MSLPPSPAPMSMLPQVRVPVGGGEKGPVNIFGVGVSVRGPAAVVVGPLILVLILIHLILIPNPDPDRPRQAVQELRVYAGADHVPALGAEVAAPAAPAAPLPRRERPRPEVREQRRVDADAQPSLCALLRSPRRVLILRLGVGIRIWGPVI